MNNPPTNYRSANSPVTYKAYIWIIILIIARYIRVRLLLFIDLLLATCHRLAIALYIRRKR